MTDLKPTTIPNPNSNSPQDLQVKITHAAVTHVDLLYARGLHQNNRRHIQPPFVLGTEYAGVVTHSLPSSSFPPGTRVFGGGLGAYAEQICVPETSIRRVPSQWTNAEACAVGASGAVSYGALLSVAQLKAGETVLVLGASGGLGVMAVQIAKAVGARVIAVVGGKEKAEVVRDIGADEVLDYGQEGWEGRVRALGNGGEGVDVVYDGIGAVESGIRCLKYRGRLVVVGFAARGGKMENLKVNKILLKGVAVFGYVSDPSVVVLYLGFRVFNTSADSRQRFGEDGRRDAQRTKDVWDGFMKLVEDGKIRPVIYNEDYWGLEAVSRALEDVRARKAWGRAVIRIFEAEEDKAEQKARL